MLTALGNRADRRQRSSRLDRNSDRRFGRRIPSLPTSQVATGPHVERALDPAQRRLLDPVATERPISGKPARRPTVPRRLHQSHRCVRLLGVIGAHEWRTKGIEIPEAGGRIHPHFGVFAPIRREYVDLIATTPLPAACASASVAFDIGTGTGVLAAVLARRGIERVVATDLDPRALACARENVRQFGLSERVDVVQADLFPEGRAALVICNPPWIPARPSSPMENGIYDPESRMLRGFLAGVARASGAGR